MKQILGMSKRCLNLKGANGPKVELDYLRLVYAVKELRQLGQEAKGYLLVMTPAIAQRVQKWGVKYQAEDTVTILTAQLTAEQRQLIEAEVRANIEGMIAGTMGEDVAGRSDATRGAQLGEQLLEQLIESEEPNVLRSTDEKKFPLGIRWDYCGSRVAVS